MQLRLVNLSKDDSFQDAEEQPRKSSRSKLFKILGGVLYMVACFLQGVLLSLQIFQGIYFTGGLLKNFSQKYFILYTVLTAANFIWMASGFFLLFGLIWNNWRYFVAHFNLSYFAVLLVLTNQDFFKVFNVTYNEFFTCLAFLAVLEFATYQVYRLAFKSNQHATPRYQLIEV